MVKLLKVWPSQKAVPEQNYLLEDQCSVIGQNQRQRGPGWDVTGDLKVLWPETVGLRNLWQFLGKGSLSGPPPWPPGERADW